MFTFDASQFLRSLMHVARARSSDSGRLSGVYVYRDGVDLVLVATDGVLLAEHRLRILEVESPDGRSYLNIDDGTPKGFILRVTDAALSNIPRFLRRSGKFTDDVKRVSIGRSGLRIVNRDGTLAVRMTVIDAEYGKYQELFPVEGSIVPRHEFGVSAKRLVKLLQVLGSQSFDSNEGLRVTHATKCTVFEHIRKDPACRRRALIMQIHLP